MKYLYYLSINSLLFCYQKFVFHAVFFFCFTFSSSFSRFFCLFAHCTNCTYFQICSNIIICSFFLLFSFCVFLLVWRPLLGWVSVGLCLSFSNCVCMFAVCCTTRTERLWLWTIVLHSPRQEHCSHRAADSMRRTKHQERHKNVNEPFAHTTRHNPNGDLVSKCIFVAKLS